MNYLMVTKPYLILVNIKRWERKNTHRNFQPWEQDAWIQSKYQLWTDASVFFSLSLLLNVTQCVPSPMWASALLLFPFVPYTSALLPSAPLLLLPPVTLWLSPLDGPSYLPPLLPILPFALSKTYISICPRTLFFLLSSSLCFPARPVERTSSQDRPGRWF